MKIFISTILIAFLFVVPELSAETSNRIVARVNDDLITLHELNNEIEALTGKTFEELKSENEEESFKIRKAVLDRMITDKLAWEKVKELELVPTKDQIDSQIEHIKEYYKLTQEDFVAKLEEEGMPYEKYLKQLTEELGVRNLTDYEIREKTVITDMDITEYYKTHKDEYKKPANAHIASIFLVPAASGMEYEADELQKKGKDILARLKNGESFADLARKFSNGPGAKDGGDLGNIQLTDVDPKIIEVINSLKEGEVSSLIDMGNRFQIIKLIKKTETEYVPLEELKDNITELLYNKEMEERKSKYMEELKKESYIKIIL